MAKIYGLFGAMSGKVADVVMSVRNGQQVVRKYQPIIADTKSEAQVAARAKLKLMSQLGAVFSPVIAMPKQGVVSSRNLFVKENYPAATYSASVADIELSDIKITKSVVALPRLAARRESGNIHVSLNNSPSTDLSRVVYTIFEKQDDNALRYFGSIVVETAGVNNDFIGETPAGSDNNELEIYAYGVRDNTEAARVSFGNLQVLTAETIAKLLVTRTLTEVDVTLTETRYAKITPSAQNNTQQTSKTPSK